MSDLVKRLRIDNSERQAFERWVNVTNPSGDSDSVQYQWENSYPRASWMEYKVDSDDALLNEAADRLEALEAALRQAREALKNSSNHVFRDLSKTHLRGSSIAAINDLLKD
jgi:hypothetical protein